MADEAIQTAAKALLAELIRQANEHGYYYQTYSSTHPDRSGPPRLDEVAYDGNLDLLALASLVLTNEALSSRLGDVGEWVRAEEGLLISDAIKRQIDLPTGDLPEAFVVGRREGLKDAAVIARTRHEHPVTDGVDV